MVALKREFTKEEAVSWNAVLDAAITDCGDVVKTAEVRQKKIQKLVGIANAAGNKPLSKFLVQLRGKNKDCRDCIYDIYSTLKKEEVHTPDEVEGATADIGDRFSALKTQRDMYYRGKKRVLDMLKDSNSEAKPADYKFFVDEKMMAFKSADDSIQALLDWEPDKKA